jgi:hypothetical protein
MPTDRRMMLTTWTTTTCKMQANLLSRRLIAISNHYRRELVAAERRFGVCFRNENNSRTVQVAPFADEAEVSLLRPHEQRWSVSHCRQGRGELCFG